MNKSNNLTKTTAVIVLIATTTIIAATLVVSTSQEAAAFRTRGEVQSGQENEGRPACGQTGDAAGPCASGEVPDAPGKFQPPNPPGEIVCGFRSSQQCDVPS